MKDADQELCSETGTENPVLVAVDFSDDSKAALVWACQFAESTSSRLILLHIVHDLASSPGFYKSNKTEHLQPMQDAAESMMDEFLVQAQSENPELQLLAPGAAEFQFVSGLPPTRIVEVAGLLNVSLIAIGSRGLTSMPHRLLGTVAERVIELSLIPVVVVKSKENKVLGKKGIKRWVKRRKHERKELKSLLGIVTNLDSMEKNNG